MKIKRYNENNDNTSAIICVIIDSSGLIVDSGAFETQTDFDNWILNMINQMINTEDFFPNVTGLEKNEDGENIFVEVADAINWYQDFYDYNVYYDIYSQIFKDQPLLYGVETIRNTKKYNI